MHNNESGSDDDDMSSSESRDDYYDSCDEMSYEKIMISVPNRK